MALLLWPKTASEAHLDACEYQWSDSIVIAANSPYMSIYRYIDEVHKNEELYQYFIKKSIETKIDIIYNTPFADCLINYESGWNPESKNPASTAHGLGQFLDSTWDNVNKALGGHLDRHNQYDQIDAFTYLLSTEGYKHWEVYPSCIHLLPIEKRISSLK
ncbi:MAG: hypothetical protein H8E55_68060 [Pelagibacterales bacterium]|nr:hypothetical protein [Pelagibacterales bacterium]